MSLQAQPLLRFSCSVLSTLASDTDILTLIHTLGGTCPDTHLHRRTHLRIQYNSLAANHPRSPPRETATSCLPQGPPPGALLQHTAHTGPLSAPRSPDKALPASLYPQKCTASVTVHELRLTASSGPLGLLACTASSPGYTHPRLHFPRHTNLCLPYHMHHMLVWVWSIVLQVCLCVL